MRIRHYLLLLLAGACGEAPDEATTGPPRAPRYVLTGVAYDSAVGLPAPGVKVTVGSPSTVTDEIGRYRLVVDSGRHVLTAPDSLYEPYQQTPIVTGDRVLDLQLRRLTPYVTGVVFVRDTIYATVVDLQGRRTLDRRQLSRLEVRGPGTVFTVTASRWAWLAIDLESWRVVVPVGRDDLTEATWRVMDIEGFEFLATCQRDGVCDHLPARH